MGLPAVSVISVYHLLRATRGGVMGKVPFAQLWWIPPGLPVHAQNLAAVGLSALVHSRKGKHLGEHIAGLLLHTSKRCWGWLRRQRQRIPYQCPGRSRLLGVAHWQWDMRANMRAEVWPTSRQSLQNTYKALTCLHSPNQIVSSYSEKLIFTFVQILALLQWTSLSSHVFLHSETFHLENVWRGISITENPFSSEILKNIA